MPLIKVNDLYKIYQMGTTEVRALDGVSLEIEQMNISASWAPLVQVNLP